MSPPKEASEQFKKRFSKAPTRHIIMIRHGQYDLDFKGDPPLTELGREQAALAGKYLANASVTAMQSSPSSTPRHVVFKKVHSSDVCRARQTAEIIAKELVTAPYLEAEGPLLQVADPMLAEGAAFPVDHSSWRPDPATFFQDGARIEAAFRKYVRKSIIYWLFTENLLENTDGVLRPLSGFGTLQQCSLVVAACYFYLC